MKKATIKMDEYNKCIAIYGLGDRLTREHFNELQKYVKYLNKLYYIGKHASIYQFNELDCHLNGDEMYVYSHVQTWALRGKHLYDKNDKLDILKNHRIINKKMLESVKWLKEKKTRAHKDDPKFGLNVLRNIDIIGEQLGDLKAYFILCLFTRFHLISVDPNKLRAIPDLFIKNESI